MVGQHFYILAIRVDKVAILICSYLALGISIKWFICCKLMISKYWSVSFIAFDSYHVIVALEQLARGQVEEHGSAVSDLGSTFR